MKKIELRAPIWAVILVVVAVNSAFAYLAATKSISESRVELLQENIQIRRELQKATKELHELELGLANIYRTTLHDLAHRVGLTEKKDGSVMLTMFNAIDHVGEAQKCELCQGDKIEEGAE